MSKKKHVKEVEVEIAPKMPESKYLMTILVLSISLVRAIIQRDKVASLEKEEGQKVIEFIGESVKTMFPEVAPMIMGLFGLELIQLMPMLKNPEIMIQHMVSEFAASKLYANPSTQPDTK